MQSESLNNKVEELRALSEHAHTSITSEMVEVKVAELENIKVSRSLAEGEGQLQMTHLLLIDRSSSEICCSEEHFNHFFTKVLHPHQSDIVGCVSIITPRTELSLVQKEAL